MSCFGAELCRSLARPNDSFGERDRNSVLLRDEHSVNGERTEATGGWIVPLAHGTYKRSSSIKYSSLRIERGLQ